MAKTSLVEAQLRRKLKASEKQREKLSTDLQLEMVRSNDAIELLIESRKKLKEAWDECDNSKRAALSFREEVKALESECRPLKNAQRNYEIALAMIGVLVANSIRVVQGPPTSGSASDACGND